MMNQQAAAKEFKVKKSKVWTWPQIILALIILLISLTCLLPFVNVLATSLSSKSAILSGKVSFFPVDLETRAYQAIFSDPSMMRSLWFTVLITVGYTVLAMVMTVLMAYLTNHATEQEREHERLNALYTLGVRFYPFVLGQPDYFVQYLSEAEAKFDKDAILEYQVELLRRFQPLVIVGHDLRGEYPHGAHILYAHCLMEAVEYAADPELYPEAYEAYGVWDVPKTYLHLAKTNAMVLDIDTPLERFGGLSSYQVAQQAMKCHVSQVVGYGFAVCRDNSAVDFTVFIIRIVIIIRLIIDLFFLSRSRNLELHNPGGCLFFHSFSSCLLLRCFGRCCCCLCSFCRRRCCLCSGGCLVLCYRSRDL